MQNILVNVVSNGFAANLDNWCGWVRNSGLEFRIEYNVQGYDDRGWGSDLVYMDENNASCLLLMQKSNPARFGTPYTHRIDLKPMSVKA